MDNTWQNSNGSFYLRSKSSQSDKLPVGIYRLELNPISGELYLQRLYDKFTFNHKIYKHDLPFVGRVEKTYKNTTGNFGVLLNGIKGTGKSVSAKLISNSLDMPTIIVAKNFDNIPAYLNGIQQDVAVFIDEFEKIFEDDGSLLSIMDGALSNEYRKAFILTTNNVFINTNLRQRPSRIRYIKSFNDMSADFVDSIVDDILDNKSLKDDCIKFISGLEIITIDLVKSIIQEVNIHNESPENFKEFFNCSREKSSYTDIYNNSTGELLWASVTNMVEIYIGYPFLVNGLDLGRIIDLNKDKRVCTVDVDSKNKLGIKSKRISLRLTYSPQTHSSYSF